MRIEEIRKSHRSQPFRPFVLQLANGREFKVDHPEVMLISRDNCTIVLDDVDGGIELINAMLVTNLHVSPTRQDSSAS